MKPIDQTIICTPENGMTGNCLQAVIASLLEMPLENILPIHEFFEENWIDELWQYLFVRGYTWRNAPEFKYAYHTENRRHGSAHFQSELQLRLSHKYYLVIGTTKRSDKIRHVCIYKNGHLVHDPHPDKTGLKTLEWFEVIEKHHTASKILKEFVYGTLKKDEVTNKIVFDEVAMWPNIDYTGKWIMKKFKRQKSNK